jgi:hypothetical protein
LKFNEHEFFIKYELLSNQNTVQNETPIFESHTYLKSQTNTTLIESNKESKTEFEKKPTSTMKQNSMSKMQVLVDKFSTVEKKPLPSPSVKYFFHILF